MQNFIMSDNGNVYKEMKYVNFINIYWHNVEHLIDSNLKVPDVVMQFKSWIKKFQRNFTLDFVIFINLILIKSKKSFLTSAHSLYIKQLKLISYIKNSYSPIYKKTHLIKKCVEGINRHFLNCYSAFWLRPDV